MYLDLPYEEQEKQRINRFLIVSLASSLLIAVLLIAGVLLLPDAALARRKTKETTVNGGPIQASLTVISSLSRIKNKGADKAAVNHERTYIPQETANYFLKGLSPLTRSTALSF